MLEWFLFSPMITLIAIGNQREGLLLPEVQLGSGPHLRPGPDPDQHELPCGRRIPQLHAIF